MITESATIIRVDPELDVVVSIRWSPQVPDHHCSGTTSSPCVVSHGDTYPMILK